ncbi:MAG: UDP-2,3-diacylglucosamine diphosphatase LpxI [bacterium]
MVSHKKMGLITGRGNLPVILAQQIKKQDIELVIISLVKDEQNELQAIANKFYSFEIGQMQTIIETLIQEGIKEIFMIGKVDKEIIFDKSKLDNRAIGLLSKLKARDDNAIMKAIIDELANDGLLVLDQRQYLSDLLAQKGILTQMQPTQEQWLDIEYGLLMAKSIASLNIGQSVVVKDRVVLAVEAIEGTDETILRAGSFGQEGLVVAKTSKSDHDFRFDIPTVGISTIKTMIKAKATVLALESEKVLIVHKDAVIKEADKVKIVIAVL